MELINELLANTNVTDIVVTAIVTVFTLVVVKGGAALKKLVLKSGNKLDDKVLAAIESKVKELVNK